MIVSITAVAISDLTLPATAAGQKRNLRAGRTTDSSTAYGSLTLFSALRFVRPHFQRHIGELVLTSLNLRRPPRILATDILG